MTWVRWSYGEDQTTNWHRCESDKLTVCGKRIPARAVKIEDEYGQKRVCWACRHSPRKETKCDPKST